MRTPYIKELLDLKPKLDLDAILNIVGVYRLMQEHRISENEALAFLGSSKSRLRTSRKKLEKDFKAITLFQSEEQGGSGKPIEDQDSFAFIEHLERLIDCYGHLRGKQFPKPLIRMGVSQELTRWFVPGVLRRYRENNPDTQFEVHIEHDEPHELRRRAFQDGRLDIVITSRDRGDEGDVQEPEIADAALLLRPYFLVQRHHPFAEESQVTWEMLKKYTVVLQKSHRPHLVGSTELMTHLFGARVLWADSYASAFAMTLASKEVCCLGFPQIMSPDRKPRFFAFAMDSPLQIPFVVYTPSIALLKHADSHAKLIRHLAYVFREEFKKLDQSAGEDLSQVLGKNMRRTWNVTRKRDRGIDWLRGELPALATTSDGYFRADHTVEPEGEAKIIFSIAGQITKDRECKDHYHILWRGSGRFDQTPPLECYAVSMTATKQDMRTRLIGHWIGRTTSAKTYHADFGYFLVVPKTDADDKPAYDQFWEWTEEYRRDSNRGLLEARGVVTPAPTQDSLEAQQPTTATPSSSESRIEEPEKTKRGKRSPVGSRKTPSRNKK